MDNNSNGTYQLAVKRLPSRPVAMAVFCWAVPNRLVKSMQTWNFFSNTGQHWTQANTTISNVGASSFDVSMAGWTVNWAGGNIDMSGDTANFAGDSGIANVTCGVDCAVGDTYALNYSAHTPKDGGGTSFKGVLYNLHLEGTVNSPAAVPVPAAVWLFGSGLVGLVGVARRKKSQT